MRVTYVDNIRVLAIIMLFPFHTARMFTHFEPFYVEGSKQWWCDAFIQLTGAWFMPLLFAVAGMSAAYALRKRSYKEFSVERFKKLLVPFFFGVILTVPLQTYYAERFHNQYTGGYFEQYQLFFTKITDFTGYTGGLTPAHLWFLLFLFAISMISLPILNFIKDYIQDEGMPITIGWLLLLLPLVIYPLSKINLAGQKFGLYFAFYVIGAIILTRSDVADWLGDKRLKLAVSACILLSSSLYWPFSKQGFNELFVFLTVVTVWVVVLAILGLGKVYLNYSNVASKYFAKASFGIYIFHQTWLVMIGYYLLQYMENAAHQFLLIMILGFILTIVSYEAVKRVPVIRGLFGIR